MINKKKYSSSNRRYSQKGHCEEEFKSYKNQIKIKEKFVKSKVNSYVTKTGEVYKRENSIL